MNKIIIIGHPTSGYQTVETLLCNYGMAKAKASTRGGMGPQEIDAVLLKAHGVALPIKASELGAQGQIKTGPLWHALALELMLANVEQQLWGWADTNAIALLDYWREMDPSIIFLLVYDEPRSLLESCFLDVATVSPNDAHQEITDWVAYNNILLDFHQKNPERSILVNAKQVQRSANNYLREVRRRLNASSNVLSLPLEEELCGVLSEMERGSNADAETADAEVETRAFEKVYAHVISEVVKQYPELDVVYSKLQSAAGLPAQALAHTQPATWIEILLSTKVVYNNVSTLKRMLAECQRSAKDALDKQKEENTVLQAQLHKVQEEADKLRVTTAEKCTRLIEENQRLSTQLSSLQCELTTERTKAPDASSLIDKSEIEELRMEITALQLQLHRTQEEAACRYPGSAKAVVEGGSQKPAASVHFAPKEMQVYTGAAARIRGQLSYRLGSAMVKNSGNIGGWLRMPFAVAREIKEFKRYRKLQGGVKLPPVSQYIDAHEADRLRKHLSYRLGQILITRYKSPLKIVTLPFAIKKEVAVFRLERDKQSLV